MKFLQWQFICQYGTHTAQESSSLFWCHDVISLQFTHVCSFAKLASGLLCWSLLRNKTRRKSSKVHLKLRYHAFCRMWLLSADRRHSACWQAMQRESRQSLLTAASHLAWYFMKTCMSESVARLPQVWKSTVSVRLNPCLVSVRSAFTVNNQQRQARFYWRMIDRRGGY